jgi:predicted RNA polymerase sigma factor
MLLLFAASLAYGQDTARVFHLHHIESTQDLNEFATLVRTIADIRDAKVDATEKTLSVKGTESQIRIAEFIFTELDRQTVPDSVSQEFTVAKDDVVRLYFLPNTPTIQSFQEIATAVRTIVDIRRLFTYNAPRVLAARGTADQIATAAFLVHELDQPATAARKNSREYQMIDPNNRGETAVQVFYLPYTKTIQQFQEAATLIRTIAEIRRVFTYNGPQALSVRGTPDQLTLVAWMINELGKPVTGDASTTYTYPGNPKDPENLIRLFYVKNAPTVAAFQQVATQVRMATKMRRVFTYNATMTMAVRGTEAELAMAQQMLQDRQVALKH